MPLASRLALLLTLSLLTAFDAQAWGAIGHRVVGQVADRHLSPKAALRVSKIIGSNSLGDVANWMDQVRNTPEGKAMKPWHYQSVDACAGTAPKCQDGQCAAPKIEAQIKALRAGTGDQLKAMRVLVHLVGDIHQPLHTAENKDFGGNSVTISNRLCVNFEGKTEACKLHSYWDNSLVKRAMGKRSEKAFVLALAAMDGGSSGGDAEAWILESNGLAKSQVHAYEGFACHIGSNKIRVNQAYDKAGSALVATQLATAGKRLASILNDIYR